MAVTPAIRAKQVRLPEFRTRRRYGWGMRRVQAVGAADFRANELPFCANAITSVMTTSAIETTTLAMERRPPYKFGFNGVLQAGREANGVRM